MLYSNDEEFERSDPHSPLLLAVGLRENDFKMLMYACQTAGSEVDVHCSSEEEASDRSLGVEVGRVVSRAAWIMWCSNGGLGGVSAMICC